MPLAHILAPQLIRKAQEIEDEIGPARPLSVGYLNAGYEKTPYDPQGLIDKKGPQSYDSRMSTEGQLMSSIGQMQRSGDPSQEAFARGLVRGIDTETPRPYLTPNAPATPGGPAIIGQTERGEPIYANPGEARPPTKTGKTILKGIDPRAAVGTNERGEDVTIRGTKQLGYLASPRIVTQHGERGGPQAQTLERGENDTMLQRDGSLRQDDKFAADVLRRKYGEAFKEVQENNMKYPSGFFAGKTEKQKQDIKDGVRALQLLEKGSST